MKIKQSDIAKKLGVSRVTVTKALSGSSDISVEMKKKVKELAEKMEYIPNLTARNLTSSQTNTIGIVVPDITNMYFSSIIRGMMEIAEKENFHIILTASRENEILEKENINNLLSMNVDGILVSPSLKTKDYSIYKKVLRRNIPLVSFARTSGLPEMDTIGFDDYEAAIFLTEFLIKKGKTKIAHITGNLNSDGKLRRDGFLEAMKQHSLRVPKNWIIKGDYFPKYGYDGFQKLLKCRELPEVVFTGNDLIAQGVYEAAREAGLRIPEDIGVVGIGHQKFAELLYPKLTIINYSTNLLGERAMKLLLSRIKKKTTKVVHKKLKWSLLKNNSVK